MTTKKKEITHKHDRNCTILCTGKRKPKNAKVKSSYWWKSPNNPKHKVTCTRCLHA